MMERSKTLKKFVTELDEILEKKLLKPNCIIPIADFFKKYA